MRWKLFNDQAAAQAYCDAGTALLPKRHGDVTAAWATPIALLSPAGTYLVPAYDGNGVDQDPSWQFPTTAIPGPPLT